MTKRRAGHHDAIWQMVRILDLPEASEITGVSEGQVRKWTDPDDDKEISLFRALELNAACIKKTGESPLLALLWGNEASGAADLNSATRRVNAALGDLNKLIDAALDPEGPGGCQITPSEARDCQDALGAILLAASRLPGALAKAAELPSLGKVTS